MLSPAITNIDLYYQTNEKCDIIISGYPTQFSNHSAYAKQLTKDLQSVCDSPIRFQEVITTAAPLDSSSINIVSSNIVPSSGDPWDVSIFILTPPETLIQRGFDESRAPDSRHTVELIKEFAPPHTLIVTDRAPSVSNQVQEHNIYKNIIAPHIIKELARKNVFSF